MLRYAEDQLCLTEITGLTEGDKGANNVLGAFDFIHLLRVPVTLQ
ncbi:MAG: hypothetical protein NVS2B12_39590 [Ktedonobacteraceae bacterium]